MFLNRNYPSKLLLKKLYNSMCFNVMYGGGPMPHERQGAISHVFS